MTPTEISAVLRLADDSGALAIYRLLLEVATFANAKAFSCNELIEHAAQPENHRLAAALLPFCNRGIPAMKLGKLFARIEDIPLAGHTLNCIGSDSYGRIWRIDIPPPDPSIPDITYAEDVAIARN